MTLNFVREVEALFAFEEKDSVSCEEIAKKVMIAVLDDQKCPYEATVDLTLTTDEEIHLINREHRGIDRATDVLSFPMTQYPVPGEFEFLEREQDAFDPDTGELLLGDIVIAYEHVKAQAEEFGHSELREFAFLVAHSMLHLIGYDHMTEEEAFVMEAKQKQILELLGITREL